jgi:hypothetical protein
MGFMVLDPNNDRGHQVDVAPEKDQEYQTVRIFGKDSNCQRDCPPPGLPDAVNDLCNVQRIEKQHEQCHADGYFEKPGHLSVAFVHIKPGHKTDSGTAGPGLLTFPHFPAPGEWVALLQL